MGDGFGEFVLLLIVVIFIVGLVVVAPRHRWRGNDANETLNPHVPETERRRRDHPEGAERSHLVGNPPVDTICADGWGVARPGEGAEPVDLPEDVHPELHEEPRHLRRH